MLRVYTRHCPPCAKTDSGYRRCHCPKWINGTLPNGKFIRISANTRSWESADRKARLMEVKADPLRQTPPAANIRITIEEAVRDFLARTNKCDNSSPQNSTALDAVWFPSTKALGPTSQI